MKKYRNINLTIFSMFFIVLNISCGIEDYKYVTPVTGAVPTMNTKADITLPAPHSGAVTIDFSDTLSKRPSIVISGISSSDFLRYYSIYYRIYISDQLVNPVNTDTARSSVNAALDSDWKAIEPYTDIKNNSASQVGSLFSNRKYYQIGFDGSFSLTRFGAGEFTLKPDAYFLNSADLNSTSPTSTLNTDVQMKDGLGGATRRSYVSMYIVHVDSDDTNLTTIYSPPAFINIFLLPQTF